jgi:hypothetical protein
MNQNNVSLDIDYQFASPIYRTNISQFLPGVKNVFDEYVEKAKCQNCISSVYPCVMTDLMGSDSRLIPFINKINDMSWNILNNQGYNMDLFHTDASEIWGQHHPYSSNMEHHIHGLDVQLCGFYFLDTPDDSSRVFFHDPRAVKVYAGLPERSSDVLTSAHNMVYYIPKPGDIFFTNAWLAHSFSRNASQQPFNFIHINVRVMYKENTNPIIV